MYTETCQLHRLRNVGVIVNQVVPWVCTNLCSAFVVTTSSAVQ